MMRRLVFLASVAFSVLLVTGCQTGRTVREAQPKPVRQVTKATSNLTPAQEVAPRSYFKLSKLTEFTITEPYSDIGQLAISADGRLIAAKASVASQWIRMYSLPGAKRAVRYWSNEFGLHDFSWHPKKNELAFGGGHASSGTANTWGAFLVLNGLSGRVETRVPVDWELSEPVTWLPDGRRLLSTNSELVDIPSRKVSLVALAIRYSRALAVSPDWVLVAERAPKAVGQPTTLETYKVKRGKQLEFERIAQLNASADSFRTQPRFMGGGRLGFVKVFLAPNGSYKSVEIWTAKPNGADERPFVKLPVLKEGVSRKFSVAPVTWSRDGRIVAYVDGQHVKVLRVIRSTAGSSVPLSFPRTRESRH